MKLRVFEYFIILNLFLCGAKNLGFCQQKTPAKPKVTHHKYVVQQGDTLAVIARKMNSKHHSHYRIFGPKSLVYKTWKLNPKLIHDPNEIEPGSEIEVPYALLDRAPAAESAPAIPSEDKKETSAPEPSPTPLPSPTPEPKPYVPDAAGKFKEIFGLGAATNLSGGGFYFPIGDFDLSVTLGLGISLDLFAEIFSATYGPSFSMLQGQYQGELRFNFIQSLWLGAGYRYFTFGYPIPAQTSAYSHDFVVEVGATVDLGKDAEWETTATGRVSMGLGSSANTTFNTSPQILGFRAQTAFHFPIGRFIAGPYVFVEKTSIDLTQAPGSTTTASTAFSYFGLGGGLHLGVRF